MKSDELAFVNLQLAGMLKSGIPLEGALRQLSTGMRRGKLRGELRELEQDLASGTPIREALGKRRLPELYRRMLLAGVGGNDLPGVLNLLADHYQRVGFISTRLKGLMVYPVIVLLASLALSFFLALLFRSFTSDAPGMLGDVFIGTKLAAGAPVLLWMPVVFLSIATAAALLGLFIPPLRRWLRWHLPGFKEAALAQLASVMGLMLKSGTSLNDALGLLHCLESRTPAGRDVACWQTRLAQGTARFPELGAGSRVIPPLFFWLVSSGVEDMPEGFRRASDIYQARAAHRTEMLLYAALPVSILFLGGMLISQAYPVIQLFLRFGTMLDALGGGGSALF